jgi:hypothetical protein
MYSTALDAACCLSSSWASAMKPQRAGAAACETGMTAHGSTEDERLGNARERIGRRGCKLALQALIGFEFRLEFSACMVWFYILILTL